MTMDMRLEIGSGYFPTPGFVHLDVNAACSPDIVGRAFPLDLGNQTVAEIRAVDVLEHLSYRDTDAALAEWFRVLRRGGRIYVQVPDAEVMLRRFVADSDAIVQRARECGFDDGDDPMRSLAFLVLGGHADQEHVRGGDDWRWNAHYALFSLDSLYEALERAGFRGIDIDHAHCMVAV
jgi:SAM-dependent methyltransferase